MEDDYKDRLLDAQVAIELHNFANAKEILKDLGEVDLPAKVRLDYLNFAGQAEIGLQEFESGRAKIRQALELAEFDPTLDPLQVERLRNWIGMSFYRQFLYEKALEQFKLCMDATMGGRITDRHFKLQVMSNMGHSQLTLNKYDYALTTYKEALTYAKVGEDDHIRASIYWGMGSAHRANKKLPEACRDFLRSSGIYERIGSTALAATARSLLGQALVDRKIYDKALEYLDQALRLTKPEDFYNLSLITLNEAYAYFELKRLPEAQERCKASIDFARQTQNPLLLGQALSQIGRIFQAENRDLDALASLKEAVEILKKTEHKSVLGVANKRYIEVTRKLGMIAEAMEAMEFAFKL